jgi:hypothetical protein
MAFVQEATAYQNLTLAREGHFAIVKLNRLKPKVGFGFIQPAKGIGVPGIGRGHDCGPARRRSFARPSIKRIKWRAFTRDQRRQAQTPHRWAAAAAF